MRAGLVSLLAASATVVLATTRCGEDSFEDLVTRTSCGDKGAVLECLNQADLEQVDEIEMCFYAGGCDFKDAVFGARWFAEECAANQNIEKLDLRKRADSSTVEASTTEETTASSAAASTTIASASATTTSDSTTSSESTSTSASAAASSTLSTSSTTSGSSSAASSSASSASGTTTSSGSSSTGLVCSTTTSISTKVCSYSSGTTIGCTSTLTAVSTCAAGMLCSTTTSGADVCMKVDDKLTTSGLIVTIGFSIGIGAFIVALLVMCWKEKRQAKRDKAERLGLLAQQGYAGGKENDGPDVEAAQAFAGRQNSRSQRSINSGTSIPLIVHPGSDSADQEYPSNDLTYNGSAQHGLPRV